MAPQRWFPIAAGSAAVAVALATAGGRGKRLDERGYRALNGTGGPLADRLFGSVTELGSIGASCAAAGVLTARGRRREAVDALGAATAMWALGQVAKKVVRRARPYRALPDVRLMIEAPRGLTWPSSHPAVLLAFVSVAARDLGLSVPAKAALGALAVVVGMSRVYLGVHYPADVAGGLLLGRGLSDLWSALVSPAVLGRHPRVASPVQ